jgi:hypothetical protein
MILPPFADNITLELFDVTKTSVVGYVFASAGASGVTQEQRWVLYAEYVSPPVRTVVLRRPTTTSLEFTSLDAFRGALRAGTGGIWRDGARYVKVNAATQAEIPSAPVPPPFPSVRLTESFEATAPLESSPAPSKTHEQIVDHPGIFQDAVLRGYVFGTPIISSTQSGITCNREYWIALPGYVTPGASTQASLEGRANIAFESLDHFLRTMRAQWVPGSSFTMASCVYATEVPQDP